MSPWPSVRDGDRRKVVNEVALLTTCPLKVEIRVPSREERDEGGAMQQDKPTTVSNGNRCPFVKFIP